MVRTILTRSGSVSIKPKALLNGNGSADNIHQNGNSNGQANFKTKSPSTNPDNLERIKLNNSPIKKDFIIFSHLRWNFVFQRPQHLLSRCAKEHRVFFVEEPVYDATQTHYLEIYQSPETVFVVIPHLRGGVNEVDTLASLKELVDELISNEKIDNYITWYYTPMALPFTKHLRPAMVIYDCMDELSNFKNPPPGLKENEEALFSLADLVFTGGQSLYEYKKNKHQNIHPFPSSIDREHFESGLKQVDPEDQLNIPHPRLGFFGVIDERLDIELLDELGKQLPGWSIVMIGPVVKINPESLPKHPNIHYLGPKSYKELPSYLGHWDVAILPFAKNDSTKFISPTKTPEYLCAGKPVVSTSIKDVVTPYYEKGLVHIADNGKTFATAVEEAYLQLNDEEWKQNVKDFLETNSWDLTWAKMKHLIHTTLDMKNLGLRKREDLNMNGNGREVKSKGTLMFDYLIVGAGFAGSVLAERLARDSNKKVLIIDKRNHIGGNAFDCYDDAGILIHKYGPHIFHTNSKEVVDYLSQFTKWRNYQHRVLASVDGMLLPIPINLDTINKMYGYNFNHSQLLEFFESIAEKPSQILTSEDVVVSKVGRELYEKFFRGYTRKQWGLDPSELNASVTARVPTRTNRDDRYFTDTYQVMPLQGYTKMFESMLSNSNIKIMLNTDYRDIMNLIPYKEMIYTGPIDEYFNFKFGKLPYRSLDFVFETHDASVFQATGTVNYPNDYAYTRISEFKHITGQVHHKTSIVYEFPKEKGDPYYPVPQKENYDLYKKYEQLAEETTPDVHFTGRLGTYKYYNMDQVVAQSLALYKKIVKHLETEKIETLQYTTTTR